MLYSHLSLLLCISVVIMAILILLITGEVQSRLFCLVNPGEIHTLKMELDTLKHEQAKCLQVEKEVIDLRRVMSECEVLKQKMINTTQENKKLADQHHSLELQLTKCGERHKQLEEDSIEKKNCEKSKRQLEIEVLDHKKEKSECHLLKQKADKTTQEKKKLLDEKHNLELQLIKFGECYEQLQNANSDKRICESRKEDLIAKLHQQDLEIVALKKENKSLYSQLYSERDKNKKLRVEKSELQLLYDGLESHCSQEKVDKERCEVSNKYNLILLFVALSFGFPFICCMRCGTHHEPLFHRVAGALTN